MKTYNVSPLTGQVSFPPLKTEHTPEPYLTDPSAVKDVIAALRRTADHLVLGQGHFLVNGELRQSADWQEALDQARAALKKAGCV